MKKLIVLLLVILLVFSLGCTQTKDDATVMLEFTKLKQDYKVKESFSPKIIVMNNYINDLSELRAESSVFVSKILDAELSSAQSFYYLLQAYESSKEINFFPTKCNIQEIRKAKPYIDTSKFISLSIKSSEEASTRLSPLNASELEHLRPNQLLIVKQYAEQAQLLEKELNSICS